MSHWNYSSWQQYTLYREGTVLWGLPVTGDIEVEVTDMRSVFRQDYVASDLPWREPEGKVWNIIQLELCMDPAEVNRILD